MNTTLSSPAEVEARLEDIDGKLDEKQNDYESAAYLHFKTKREKEKLKAIAFLQAEGTVAERSAIADRETAEHGIESEAEYEALKVGVRTLEARATIAQSILKSQGRS